MDGPWVKAYAALEVHRKTARMVATLDCIPAVVIGGLMQVWWMGDREATPDGFLPHTTREDIDAKVRVPGFAAAMEAVGWLEVSGDGVALPEFDKHMGQKHRKRARDRKHAKAYRDRQKRQRRVSADAVLTDTDRQCTVSGSSDKTETKTVNTPSECSPPTPPAGGASARKPRAAKSKPDWRADLQATEFAALAQHPGFADAWDEWLAYRRESRLKLPVQRTWKSAWRKWKADPAGLVEAIQNSIGEGYQGIYPPKTSTRASGLPSGRSGLMSASEAVALSRARRAQQGAPEGPRDVDPERPFRLVSGE